MGGLMRPTKSWLNHLGETGGQSSKGSASLTNGTVNGGTADDGTAVVTRKNSSQKATQETSSSSVSSSSTTSSFSASTNSGKSESSKEKNLPTNNKVGNPPTLTDGKESEVVQGKESHSAGEQKEPASKINGIVERCQPRVTHYHETAHFETLYHSPRLPMDARASGLLRAHGSLGALAI